MPGSVVAGVCNNGPKRINVTTPHTFYGRKAALDSTDVANKTVDCTSAKENKCKNGFDSGDARRQTHSHATGTPRLDSIPNNNLSPLPQGSFDRTPAYTSHRGQKSPLSARSAQMPARGAKVPENAQPQRENRKGRSPYKISMMGSSSRGAVSTVEIRKESVAKANCVMDSVENFKSAKRPRIMNDSRQNLLTGFTKGRSNAQIEISEESMAKASRILDSTEKCFATGGSNIRIEISEESMAKANRVSGSKESKHDMSNPQNMLTGFTKGKSNARIEVSEESIANATRLLDSTDSNHSILQAKNTKQSCAALNAGKGGKKLFTGFTTGGSKARIEISEESMAKAVRVFDFTESTNGFSAGHTKEVRTMPKSGQGDRQHMITGFRRGCSNARIEISEESMARAIRVLNSKERNRDMPHNKNITQFGSEENMATASGVFDPGEENHEMIHLENAKCSTTTTPLGPLNNDSQYALMDFMKGRSNTKIQTSEESMAKATQVFDSGGRNHAISLPQGNERFLTNDETANSPEPQNESVGVNQRVRFLLVSESAKSSRPSTTKSDHSEHVQSSENGIELGAWDVHRASSAGTSQEKKEVHFDAFVTPDKRYLSKGATDTRHSKFKMMRDEAISKSGPSENIKQMKVVTSEKDALAVAHGVRDASPLEPNTYTPLNEVTNIANDSLQSVIKSKRLFENAKKKYSEKNSQLPTDASILINHSKVTLSQFAAKHSARVSDWATCIEHGVHNVTMRVTSLNANQLRFSKEFGTPLFFLGQRDTPDSPHVGKITDLTVWLSGEGCDSALFSAKWVQNHYRWIVWKLAAMVSLYVCGCLREFG